MLRRFIVMWALAASAGPAAAQTVELVLARAKIAAGEAVRASAIVTNAGEAVAAWKVHAFLYSSDPRAPVPRTFEGRVELAPGGRTAVDFALPTGPWTVSGAYDLRVELIDPAGRVVGRATEPIRLEGVRVLELEVQLCRDEACKAPARLFQLGDGVYARATTNAPTPRLAAMLFLPGGEKREVTLPARIPAERAGDHRLVVRATAEGFTIATRSVPFGVVAKLPALPESPTRE